MWQSKWNFKSRGILADTSQSINDKIDEKFKIGIFFGTSESRGLISSGLLADKSCFKSLIIFFKEFKNHKLRKNNDLLLLKQVEKCTSEKPYQIHDVSIQDVDLIIKKILDYILESHLSSDDKVFFDISGCPKPYFLGLLGYMRYKHMSPKFTLFYPEGDYEKGSTPNIAHSFTAGFNRYMWIPYLWGRPNPDLPWNYIFLLGFEGGRSHEIYDRFEPSLVEALIGKPGYRPEYTDITIIENKLFLEEAKPKRLYSDAADPAITGEILLERIKENKTRSNICFVPLGTKPHSLGAALASLTDGSSSILYLMPRSFTIRDTPRGKHIWLYDITL